VPGSKSEDGPPALRYQGFGPLDPALVQFRNHSSVRLLQKSLVPLAIARLTISRNACAITGIE